MEDDDDRGIANTKSQSHPRRQVNVAANIADDVELVFHPHPEQLNRSQLSGL